MSHEYKISNTLQKEKMSDSEFMIIQKDSKCIFLEFIVQGINYNKLNIRIIR